MQPVKAAPRAQVRLHGRSKAQVLQLEVAQKLWILPPKPLEHACKAKARDGQALDGAASGWRAKFKHTTCQQQKQSCAPYSLAASEGSNWRPFCLATAADRSAFHFFRLHEPSQQNVCSQ
jgi:hypothetical protein